MCFFEFNILYFFIHHLISHLSTSYLFSKLRFVFFQEVNKNFDKSKTMTLMVGFRLQ